jgi:hypothetical protein
MLADCGCSIIQGIEGPDRVGLARHRRDFGLCCAVKLGDLAVGGELSAEGLAPEHEGNNAARHVLVDRPRHTGTAGDGCLIEIGEDRAGPHFAHRVAGRNGRYMARAGRQLVARIAIGLPRTPPTWAIVVERVTI